MAADHGDVARADHPMRTPFYGAVVIISALIVCYGESLPGWLHGALLFPAIPIALAGWPMAFNRGAG